MALKKKAIVAYLNLLVLSIDYFGVTYTVRRNRVLIDIYRLCALNSNSIHTLVTCIFTIQCLNYFKSFDLPLQLLTAL